MQVWNASTGTRLDTYRGQSGFVCCLAWSPDGTTIASSGADGTIQVWSAFFGQHILTLLDQQDINAIAWSPRGPLLATAGEDDLVTVWVMA